VRAVCLDGFSDLGVSLLLLLKRKVFPPLGVGVKNMRDIQSKKKEYL